MRPMRYIFAFYLFRPIAIIFCKGKDFPILATERCARSWSQCTGGQATQWP